MAAGDKSKKLVIEIRDAIGDNDNLHYKNDNGIYERLNYYQTLFMTTYFTTFKRWEIPLAAAIYKYPMDDSILAVTHKPYSNNDTDYRVDWIHEPYPTVGEVAGTKRIFILQNEAEIVSGNKIYVESFVKATAPISELHDPEIGDDYLPWLKEAVKSEHKDRLPDKGFQSLKQVLNFVKGLSSGVKTKKLAKGSSLRNINF